MADQTFAVNCGFFDAINSDRVYSADEMNRPYKRVISNGVFATPNGTPSTDLQVTASSGMNIICKKGEGLFGDKWFENPSGIAITVPSNTGTVPRIDSVLVQVDTRTSGRVGNIVHRTGTPSSSPVPPAINQVEGVVEYRLANIRVNAGVSAITQSMITDRRGSSDCPWVTSLIYQVDTSTLYDQWQAAYEEYFEEQQQAWNEWYSHLTEELDVSMTLDRHTNTVTTTAQTTGTIPIGLDYNHNTDILEVYINGLRAIEGTHYVVVDGDTSIQVENQLDIGQAVTFVVMRSVIGGGGSAAGYVTPEMYGAKGDGVADDTTAVRNALKYSIDNGKKLLLPNTYYITQSLLTSSDYDDTVVVDIEGTAPLKNYIYTADAYGGIIFANGINVFDGLTIRGSIYRVAFMPVTRTQTGSIFYNCSLRAFMFSNCQVSNILAFCHNTDAGSVTQIINSRFLTVYYFAKCDTVDDHYGFIDSKLTGNYINGGAEMTDNHCFEWYSFNGAEVSGNFIDYYQTIYYPKSNINFTFQGGVSVGNQYQVFRYLYYPGTNCIAGMFSSVSDCFNSTDPTKLAKLTTYVKYTYTGYDSQEHDIPPCILLTLRTWNVSIINAILQNNVGNCIFVKEALTEYVYAKAEFTFVSTVNSAYSSCVSSASSLYTAGSFKNNLIKIPFAMIVESLPSINASRSDYYPGQLVTMNNTIYRYVNVYNSGTGTYTPTWVDVTAYK